MATKKEIEEIRNIFISNYEYSATELNFTSDFELLIAIILSAQCTDKRVNIITPELFKKYPTAFELSIASYDEVKMLINSCSFFNNKAKNIIKMAQRLVDLHDSKVPQNQKELMALAGVGQKTAHVFLIEYTNANLMAVDTHVFRVSHRLGLSGASNVKDTELDLVKKFKTDLRVLHQGMVLFGRYVCKSVSPQCHDCILAHHCKSKLRYNPNHK